MKIKNLFLFEINDLFKISLRCAYACFLISQAKPLNCDMNCDLLLMFARRSNSNLQVLKRLLTHSITSRFADLKNSNQFGLEHDSIAEKSRGFIAILN